MPESRGDTLNQDFEIFNDDQIHICVVSDNSDTRFCVGIRDENGRLLWNSLTFSRELDRTDIDLVIARLQAVRDRVQVGQVDSGS